MKNRTLSSNAVLNTFKTVFSYAVSLIVYMYIIRIFSVDDIGRMHFGESLISWFMLIGGLGIGTFAIRTGSEIRKDKDELRILADRMFTVNIISTAVSFGLLILLISFPSKISEYRMVILIQSITVLLSPLAVEWIYTIYEDFRYIALKSIVVHLIFLAMLLVFVNDKADFYLYLLLDSAVTGLGDIFSFLYSGKFFPVRPTRDVQWRIYAKPIMTIFAYDLTATVYVHADTVMLGLMGNDVAVAMYGVSTKIYFVLKNLFNAALAVTVPRIAALWDEDRAKMEALVCNVVSFAVIFTIPAAVGLILLRNDIIQLVAGSVYHDSVYPLAFLAVSLIFSVLATILSKNLLISIGREKAVAGITLVSAVLNITLNLIFIPRFSYVGAAFTTLIAEMTVFIGSLIVVRRYIRGIFRFRDFRDAAIGCLVMAAVISLVLRCMPEGPALFRIAATIPIGVISYILTLLLLKDNMILAVYKGLAARFGRR